MSSYKFFLTNLAIRKYNIILYIKIGIGFLLNDIFFIRPLYIHPNLHHNLHPNLLLSFFSLVPQLVQNSFLIPPLYFNFYVIKI